MVMKLSKAVVCVLNFRLTLADEKIWSNVQTHMAICVCTLLHICWFMKRFVRLTEKCTSLVRVREMLI